MEKSAKSLSNWSNTNIKLLENTLAGEQKQRPTIARAILKGDFLLILNKKTSAIDTKMVKIIRESSQKINNDKNIAIIFIFQKLSSFLVINTIIDINKEKVNFELKYKEFVNKKN